MPVRRVWSGGQTGVDRAALDAGLAVGLPVGGWCPHGGWAEDGADLLALYPQLRETPSADPSQRTRWNVRDSDATLILVREGALSPGTDFTLRCAAELAKPVHVTVLPGDVDRDFLDNVNGTLNVAGPRESQAPGIYAEAWALLEALLPQFRPRSGE